MRIMRIAVTLALAALLCGAAARADDPGYLNLTPNLETVYMPVAAQDGVKNQDLLVRTYNQGAANGWILHSREILHDGYVLERREMLLSRSADGDILFHGDAARLFDRPVTWVDAPLEVGKTWTSAVATGDKTAEPDLIHYVFAVLAEETVTCPLGDVPCFRVFVATVNPDGSSEGCSFWYNPQCGLIRCCLEGSGAFVLYKTQVRDRTDRDFDDPPVATDLTVPVGSPNPFNPSTRIRFHVAQEMPVSVVIYDLAGRLVRRLAEAEDMGAGEQEVIWDGRDDAGRNVPSGAYVARVAGGRTQTSARLMLVR